MKASRNTQSSNPIHTPSIRNSITNGLGIIRGMLGATYLIIKSI